MPESDTQEEESMYLVFYNETNGDSRKPEPHMADIGRYFRNADRFKEDAFTVLQTKFLNRQAFELFYESIATPQRKNEFLNIPGTSMISFVKGKTEISRNLPNSPVALFLLLHAVQSF